MGGTGVQNFLNSQNVQVPLLRCPDGVRSEATNGVVNFYIPDIPGLNLITVAA